jgi:hypothetical protein
MNQTDIRIIQQQYIRALQELGRLHNELNAAGEGAWGDLFPILEEMALQEHPSNWPAFEMMEGREALCREDDDEGASGEWPEECPGCGKPHGLSGVA